ncbi:hypothetical protein PR202_gb07654 [Eleusine coracana subsp. coracana]|uniref:Uncharacterized protein n=1 Tax=Eleusine coracana subsp. coracana TaxID=191504 RepID=A0AAV5ECT0_ELECO|nr:hypothetical protein PR202_gb07654 [Eleusine coracana subsp. coracana]
MAFVDIKFHLGDKICFGAVSLIADQHGNLVKQERVARSVDATADQSDPASQFPLGLNNAATVFQAETLSGGNSTLPATP